MTDSVLETHAEEYREEWLEIYETAENLTEFESGTDAGKAIARAATGVKETIDSSGPKTVLNLSYLLDSVILAIDLVLDEGNREDEKALQELIEMASKTASYVLVEKSAESDSWTAVDHEKTIEHVTDILKAEKVVS